MSACFDNPASLALLLPEDHAMYRGLVDASFDLATKATTLGAGLQPPVRAAIGDLVRGMNCYYSNLIEGHSTLPVDIERALKGDFSGETREKRNLQQEAVAHIAVQKMIDEGRFDGISLGEEWLRRVHYEFCTRLPDDMLTIRVEEEDAKGEKTGVVHEYPVVPGKYRTDYVKVGQHKAVEPSMVPAFMQRFDRGYSKPYVRATNSVIATAAAHHRLLWIHPFLDGNGRVARLHSYAMLKRWGIGSELWSVARGLARRVNNYKAALQRADDPPQFMTDGRGTLSDGRLAELASFFIEVCKDQVEFMATMIEPAGFMDRIGEFVLLEGRRSGLDSRVERVMKTCFMTGSLSKGELASVIGVESHRHATRLIEPLLQKGLLVSEGHHGAYRLAFPLDQSEVLFPRLFAPAGVPDPKVERTPQLPEEDNVDPGFSPWV